MGLVGDVVGGLVGLGASIFGSNQAKKQAEKEAAAAERARLASATVQAVSTKNTVEASDTGETAETATASKKKRRFSVSKTVNNAGMAASLTGKSILG